MKVVLIDGNGTDRHAIRSMLEERDESVFPFANGLDAWSFIEETPDIDVIIAALGSPGMSGLEICWNARVLAHERKGLYVIATSEGNEPDLLVEALDTGADDYLHKPLHEEILHARLRVAERMITLQKELQTLAERDPLTNLYNRRAFFEQVSKLIEQSGGDRPVCAIMFDIDHFKRVNDTFGHDVGDAVICKVAELAAVEDGVLGRLGGEEFALVLKDMGLLPGARIADTIRQNIEDCLIQSGKIEVQVTSSFGVSLYRAGEEVDDLLKRADLALYKSKNDGRNRVSAERPQLLIPSNKATSDDSDSPIRQSGQA